MIGVEAQRELKKVKRWRIPVYQANLADEFDLPPVEGDHITASR